MDALLRFLLYRITWSLLLIEFLIMVVCVILIVIIKLFTRWNTARRERIHQELSRIFEMALFNDEPVEKLQIPQKLCESRNLVEVLEKFDQRFSDPRWKEIKQHVARKFLHPIALKEANSWSWFKRQLAARSFLLTPKKDNEEILRGLLNDKKYLVRVVAAVCICKGSSKELFYEMLKKMSSETRLSQFPYRDALVQADEAKFTWIEQVLKDEKDPAIAAICLDTLSTRYSKNLFNLIRPFINAKDFRCRILAIKALGIIPTKESIEVLTDHLLDSDWNVRGEAAAMIHQLHAVQAINTIKHLLNDPVWWVRLQGALALKSFGSQGKEILAEQNQEKDPLAYEISQYVLALP